MTNSRPQAGASQAAASSAKGKGAAVSSLVFSLLALLDLAGWYLTCVLLDKAARTFRPDQNQLLSPVVNAAVTSTIIALFLFFIFAVLGVALSSYARARGYRNKLSLAGRLIGIGDLCLMAIVFILWLI